ncbi:MAG: SurA N-terminal domain-containing protein [Patescibacteria group bacterium]|jgi:foldase protein PrsA
MIEKSKEKTAKKASGKVKAKVSQPKTMSQEKTPAEEKSFKISVKKLIIFLAIIIIGFLLYQNKDLFIVATVNNRPISRQRFNQQIESQYGQQVLETMINEELIKQAAKDQNIVIDQEKINEEMAKIEKSLPEGMNLDQALQMQGMSRENLEEQMRLQLAIEEILAPKIQITDEELKQYIEENKDYFSATQEAQIREEAQEGLRQQKLNQNFQAWLQELTEKANINRWLKF